MQNIETYNRVPALDSTVHRHIILYGYALSALAVIFSLFGLLVEWLPWLCALITGLSAVVSIIILRVVEFKRVKRCKQCRSALDSITRPFILNAKNLASHGTKIGDYFFSYCRWGNRPFTKRWAKISRRSLACHHCRLTETRAIDCYEHVSVAELNEIKSRMVD